MIVLLKLILAHFIGDFVFQPKSWVLDKQNKKVKSPKLYIHLLIHGFLILLLLWDFECWNLILLLVLLHGIIDILKLYVQKEKKRSGFL